jgi:hypothetical protein
MAETPPDLKALEAFLRLANQNTYANAAAAKAKPLRPGSSDYHFEQGPFAFHDTYFGGVKFIGSEIIYYKGGPVWGMNYHGRLLTDKMDEAAFDKCLRSALMTQDPSILPLRGPTSFTNGRHHYTFCVSGTLADFSGTEEMTEDGTVIYRCLVHGGLILR